MEQFRSSLYDYYSEVNKVTPLAFIVRLVIALKEFHNFNASIDPNENKIVKNIFLGLPLIHLMD